MLEKANHQFTCDLGLVFTYTGIQQFTARGQPREEHIPRCPAYARQNLDDIIAGGSDPFLYRLQDLWLDLHQAPWAIPQEKEQLLNDLSAKVASGELFIYRETDLSSLGPGQYERSGPGAPPEPPEDAPRTGSASSTDSASMSGAPVAGLPVADSDGVNAGSAVGGEGVVPDKEPSVNAVQAEGASQAELSPSRIDWNNSGPNGLQVKDPRDIEVGSIMYESLLEKGLEPDLALTISRELLESGAREPSVVKLKSGDKLYKVVPKNGGPPGDNSPYFMTKEMLDKLPEDTDEAGSILGLPQIPRSFDIYSITARTDVDVFQSQIAPFSVNGGECFRSGGGMQALVINRDKFTSPNLLGD